jgi:hypothetical protein
VEGVDRWFGERWSKEKAKRRGGRRCGQEVERVKQRGEILMDEKNGSDYAHCIKRLSTTGCGK